MSPAQQRRSGGRDRSGAVVAVLSGFLLTGAILAGVALLFPDLVSDLNIMSSSGDEPSTTTEAPITEGARDEAQDSVVAFATALESGDLGAVRFAPSAVPLASTTTSVDSETSASTVEETTTSSAPAAVAPATDYTELTAGLDAFTIAVEEGEATLLDGDNATAPLQLTWTFEGDMQWSTTTEVDLVRVDDDWLVDWKPSILESSLRDGDRLVSDRISPTRAPILARDGTVLVEDIALVEVGIQPSRVEDLPSLTQRLAEVLAIDPVELTDRVNAASPDAFVEVTTLPRADYDLVRDDIFPLPGTVFKDATRPASIDPNFARALLGRSGEVTAEIIEEFPGLFAAGDFAGLSGLQATYNAELSGQPGLEIAVIRAAPDPSTTTTGTGLITTSSVIEIGEPQMLFAVPATDGQPLQTTIDPVMQRAAEAALQREPSRTSAFVAVQVSTGEVVAVANGPTGASVNFAMTGQYPPGSIFKVVSGYTLLRDRIQASDPVNCPLTIEVLGRSFANAENEVLGQVDFRSAFAHSCNTAFVSATLGYGPEVLNEAAADFGLGVEYDLGESAFSGSVPINEDEVDLAAAAFGQGRLLMSPLSAAVMAATAAGGTYRSPLLVTSPPRTPQVVEPLEPGAAASLRELMRAVVTEGTGRNVATVAGGPVSGKTGTAEFGNDNPPRSHAWFVGYQGDIAFAAFVEAGEFGGSTAAPIAAEFLNIIAN